VKFGHGVFPHLCVCVCTQTSYGTFISKPHNLYGKNSLGNKICLTMFIVLKILYQEYINVNETVMLKMLKGKISRSRGNSSEDSLCRFIAVPVTGLECYLHILLKLNSYFVTYILYIVYVIMDAVNMREGNFV
jgi:hypothetical protein